MRTSKAKLIPPMHLPMWAEFGIQNQFSKHLRWQIGLAEGYALVQWTKNRYDKNYNNGVIYNITYCINFFLSNKNKISSS
jgi:hypothetical protein